MARVRANAATRVSTARFSRPRSLHPCFDGPFAALPLAFTWTVYEDITKTIGNTPVVKISDKLCPEGVELYAKCEYFNPLASVKDRLAVAIIEDAEKRGELKPGMTVVEATSGNTGIAMACA